MLRRGAWPERLDDDQTPAAAGAWEGEDDGEVASQRPAAPAVGNVNRFRLRQPRREEKPKEWIDE
jgi:hypothetical protein